MPGAAGWIEQRQFLRILAGGRDRPQLILNFESLLGWLDVVFHLLAQRVIHFCNRLRYRFQNGIGNDDDLVRTCHGINLGAFLLMLKKLRCGNFAGSIIDGTEIGNFSATRLHV